MKNKTFTIAWDIDDVLNELMKEWFEKLWKLEHPECKVDYKDILKNPPHELLGVSKEEYLASLDEFRRSKYFELKPIPEVLDWFSKYGDRCRHIALTSTPFATASISAEWVIRNYGKWIRTFHFIPSHREGIIIPQYDKNKGEYLGYNKVDFFVDDSLENIQSVEAFGIKTITFPRPWNNNKNSLKETFLKINKLLQI
ncbi:hypothetical protein KJ786_03425 [Patescibacteria group bacterium]|nr:hypothetical protein [Patescibacteria group bacterium]